MPRTYGSGRYGSGTYGAIPIFAADAPPRAIDPVQCEVRHIIRGAAGESAARQVAGVFFVRAEIVRGEDGMNGRQGWQQAEATLVLSDDGSFALVFPNGVGDDGLLHRRRFACMTDPNYEPGEEWLEFWTDAIEERPLFVGTPTDYEKTRSTVTIKGADLATVLAGVLSSDVDVWDAQGPADVLQHYSRIPALAYGADDLGVLLSTSGSLSAPHVVPVDGVSPDCWSVVVGTRVLNDIGGGGPDVVLRNAAFNNTVGGIADDAFLRAEFNTTNGSFLLLFYFGGTERVQINGKGPTFGIGEAEVRIVARYDHLFIFLNGEMITEVRRETGTFLAPDNIEVSAFHCTLALDRLHVESLEDFAARGPSAVLQRRLPGIPPATGLRGRYWGASSIYAPAPSIPQRQALAFPLGLEPATDRLDPQVDWVAGLGSPRPPGIAAEFYARWTGSIYLDLETAGYKLKLASLAGLARIYVGKTLRGDEAGNTWYGGAPSITTPELRGWIGEAEAGWYPLVIELTQAGAELGIVLQGAAADPATGDLLESFATIPTARLSPIGCYEDVIRNTPHRTIIGDVAQTFGYQWRLLPRSLESGEFPGQFEAGSLVGRQTNLTVDDEQVGSEVVVQGAAADVADAVLADAAGIAGPDGSGQLSAQIIDYERAVDHLALRQSYESLSDITEAPLLQTRIDSLLALRSSPNEQVGVRPRGQIDLTDTFELSGDLAKMTWSPGDGVLLDLESVDVKDESPRQLTTVSWSPRPDGLGVPTVGFRQRPRSPAAALKRLRAAIFGPRRTYQGSRTTVPGAPGGTSGTVDEYSRVTLPARLDRITRVVAVVQVISASVGTWRLEVNGVDLGAAGQVVGVGRYDVTSAAKPADGRPYAYARLIGATGTYLMTLEVERIV